MLLPDDFHNISHSFNSPAQTHCLVISPVLSTCHSLLSWMRLEKSWELRVCPTCSERQEWTCRNHCGLHVAPVSQHVMLFWLLTCLATLGCVSMTVPGLNGLKGHVRNISSQREMERRCEQTRWERQWTATDKDVMLHLQGKAVCLLTRSTCQQEPQILVHKLLKRCFYML